METDQFALTIDERSVTTAALALLCAYHLGNQSGRTFEHAFKLGTRLCADDAPFTEFVERQRRNLVRISTDIAKEAMREAFGKAPKG